MSTQPLPGFRDFYPSDFALRAHIFRTWRSVARCYGFEEYDGPPLEPLELYTAKSGDEIVGQLYAFTDKGGRAVAMRPEMTPTLARMVAARANGLKKPVRWFAIPQLFRYERQQRGRLREHFQLNCDLIGEAGPLADAEIVAVAIDVMRAFGFTERDVQVRLSDRRVLAALLRRHPDYEGDRLRIGFEVLDKIERQSREASAKRLRDAGCATEAIDLLFSVAALRGLAPVLEALQDAPGGEAAGAALADVVGALEAMGLGGFVEVDPTIVRGLAYYTGTVFEIFDTARTLRAVAGGGRFDNLLQQLGGVDLPALGFGMGDVVLSELLRDRGLAPADAASVDVFLAGITADDQPHLLALAHELRDAGIRAEYALGAGAPNVGKQLKLADARGARLAIVIGPDDRARGEVMLKDLAAKTQRALPRDQVIADIGRSLPSRPS